MRKLIAIAALVAAALLLWAWLSGAGDALAAWAQAQQHQTQTALARALRALRAGEPGALFGFASLCFAYGFFHAIGPGHGKLVVAGVGVARSVSVWRLGAVAVAGSLMQGVVAVVLVFAGVSLLQATRGQITDLGEDWLAPASAVAIIGIGLWLMWRGAARLMRMRGAAHCHDPHHDHAHDHDHHHHDHSHDASGQCPSCGHSHAPDPRAVAEAVTFRETAALVMGVGIRPCTGALFVLILGWRMGIELAAILGTFAMALGTASVTLVVAVGAVVLRSTAFAGWGEGPTAARVAALIEIGAGALVAVIAIGLLTSPV